MMAMWTVHVIDDEEFVRDSIASLLSAANFDVRTHASVLAFMEIIDSVTSGCIITDLKMPGASGIDLLKKLNALKADIPVIVITGHGDVPLAVEAMKLGAMDFLEKPFDAAALLRLVQTALNKEHSNSSLQAERFEIESRLALLSKRERDVFDGLVTGHGN